MIHVDTSFLVDVMRERSRSQPGPASALLARLRDEELRISVHAACELYAGAELSERPERERTAIVALCSAFEFAVPDERFPPTYARLLASLERRGERAPLMDLLIATAAVVDQAPLVTRDAKGFERIPDLKVVGY